MIDFIHWHQVVYRVVHKVAPPTLLLFFFHPNYICSYESWLWVFLILDIIYLFFLVFEQSYQVSSVLLAISNNKLLDFFIPFFAYIFLFH